MNERKAAEYMICKELRNLAKTATNLAELAPDTVGGLLDTIESQKQELASYMESDENLRKKSALEDGLRELAEKWRTEDTSYYGEGHAAADDVEELLGKEPAPSPPPADDGSQAADGVGS